MLKVTFAFSLLFLIVSTKVQLKSSPVDLIVKISGGTTINEETNLLNPKDITLRATQSSKIYANIKLAFSKKIQPEFVAGRLIHSQFSNTSKTVLGLQNKGTGRFELKFDIGDPRVVQPISGKYQLEILVGDQQISYRKVVAQFDITFIKSLNESVPSQLHYEPKSQIIFKLDNQTVQTHSFFTLFVVVLISLSFFGFFYSLVHLKVNLNKFPLGGLGGILNILFISLIVLTIGVLIKFWINWTFIQTIKVLGVLVIPTVIVGNYAILSIRK